VKFSPGNTRRLFFSGYRLINRLAWARPASKSGATIALTAGDQLNAFYATIKSSSADMSRFSRWGHKFFRCIIQGHVISYLSVQTLMPKSKNKRSRLDHVIRNAIVDPQTAAL